MFDLPVIELPTCKECGHPLASNSTTPSHCNNDECVRKGEFVLQVFSASDEKTQIRSVSDKDRIAYLEDELTHQSIYLDKVENDLKLVKSVLFEASEQIYDLPELEKKIQDVLN